MFVYIVSRQFVYTTSQSNRHLMEFSLNPCYRHISRSPVSRGPYSWMDAKT